MGKDKRKLKPIQSLLIPNINLTAKALMIENTLHKGKKVILTVSADGYR